MAELPTGDAEETESADEKGGEMRSRLATASLKLGILSLMGLFGFAIPAIIVGFTAISGNAARAYDVLTFLPLVGLLVLSAILAIILRRNVLYKVWCVWLLISPVPTKSHRLVIAGLVFDRSDVFFLVLTTFGFGAIMIPTYAHLDMYPGPENIAIGNLYMVTGAQTAYKDAHGAYARSFAELTDATAFLLGEWEGMSKSGWNFTLKSTDNGNCYEATASPTIPGRTGIEYYFTDCSGVIRENVEGPANSTSQPLRERRQYVLWGCRAAG